MSRQSTQSVELYAVAATLRTSARGTQFLMVECSKSEEAKGGFTRILGNWGSQSEFFESVLAQMPKDGAEVSVDKRLRLTNAVSLGKGVIYTDDNVPKLIQHRKRIVRDDDGNDTVEDAQPTCVSSVSVVALDDLGENFRTLVDAEMMRRCLAQDEPEDGKAGTWYVPVRGEDYSDYYIDPITWADVRAELFGDIEDEEVSE